MSEEERHSPHSRVLPIKGRGDAIASNGQMLDLWLVDLISGASVLVNFARELDLIPLAEPAITPHGTARAALRILLAGHVGLDVARQPFVIAPGGKPSLAGAASPPVEFSLAHGDTAAIVVISRDGPVGIDLEEPRSVRLADDRRAALIAAAASLAPETPLPDGPGDARFLQAWTRLEALAKATGEGLGPLLERVRRDGSPVARTAISGHPVHVRDVRVRSSLAVYAAVAGTSASLASSPAPEAMPLPLDRTWLEQWLSGDPSSPQRADPPSSKI